MYVYKSTAESRVTNAVLRAISLATQDRAAAGGGKPPCFGVCALVCDFSRRAECVPAFAHESERGAFVREVENRDEKLFGTALQR